MKFLIPGFALILGLLNSAAPAAASPDWKYKIVMNDERWPTKSFVLLVAKSNQKGIQSFETQRKLGEEMGYGPGYIGIPIGPVRTGAEQDIAHGWSYRIDANKVEFAEQTIEVCDATFDYVEQNLEAWIRDVRNYCPWGASSLVMEIWNESKLIYRRTRREFFNSLWYPPTAN